MSMILSLQWRGYQVVADTVCSAMQIKQSEVILVPVLDVLPVTCYVNMLLIVFI